MKMFPAVRDPGSIELLFRSVRTGEEPDKITADYLTSVGFRRQSDVKLLELLFFLGFVDNSLSPTDRWKSSKNLSEKEFRKVLAETVSEAYNTVFAYQKENNTNDSKALMAYFKAQTGVSDTEAAYMLLTLQVLLDLSNYDTSYSEKSQKPAVPAPEEADAPAPPQETAYSQSTPKAKHSTGVSLNITITADAMDDELMAIVKALIRKSLPKE